MLLYNVIFSVALRLYIFHSTLTRSWTVRRSIKATERKRTRAQGFLYFTELHVPFRIFNDSKLCELLEIFCNACKPKYFKEKLEMEYCYLPTTSAWRAVRICSVVSFCVSAIIKKKKKNIYMSQKNFMFITS